MLLLNINTIQIIEKQQQNTEESEKVEEVKDTIIAKGIKRLKDLESP